MDIRLIKCSFVRSCSDHKIPRTYIVLLFPFWSLKYNFINKTKQQPFPPWGRLGVLLAPWIQNLVIVAIEAQCLGCESGLDSCFWTVMVTIWHIRKSIGVGAKDEDSGPGACRMSGLRHRLLSFSSTVLLSPQQQSEGCACLTVLREAQTKYTSYPRHGPASEC